MELRNLLLKKHLTAYRLAKESHLPLSTIGDLVRGTTKLSQASGATLYRIARALNVPMETLLFGDSSSVDFATFKSEQSHKLKREGDISYLRSLYTEGGIRSFYEKKEFAKSFYLLALADYLSRLHRLPLVSDYDDIRCEKLSEPLYPPDLLLESELRNDETILREARRKAIKEFKRFNLMEGNVRDVE